jgi:hypothetical protein
MKCVRVFEVAISAVLLVSGICWGSVDAKLAWDPAMKDVNGNVLTDTVGYRLYFSNSSGVYSQYVDVGSATVANVTGLGYNKTYYFRAKAYTASGESAYSEEVVWVAPAMPDSDADGISDSWELEHFSSTDLTHKMTDYDHDGSSDLNEFLAGTNPADSNEYPSLAIRNATTGTTLSFQARQAAGAGYENRTRYYTLKQCDDLASGIWTSVPGQANIPAANQTVSFVISSDIRNAYYCTEIRLD